MLCRKTFQFALLGKINIKIHNKFEESSGQPKGALVIQHKEVMIRDRLITPEHEA